MGRSKTNADIRHFTTSPCIAWRFRQERADLQQERLFWLTLESCQLRVSIERGVCCWTGKDFFLFSSGAQWGLCGITWWKTKFHYHHVKKKNSYWYSRHFLYFPAMIFSDGQSWNLSPRCIFAYTWKRVFEVWTGCVCVFHVVTECIRCTVV